MADNKLFIVGIGPGDTNQMSRLAYDILQRVDVIVGYNTYLDLIRDLISERQEIYCSGMGQEKDRAKKAIEYAGNGNSVAVVSSGDAGVYGMAGLVLEMIENNDYPVNVDVIPGITAANAVAALLGAPLMHDYAVISLSNLLTPWNLIENRLQKAAEGDFITVLYNPKSNNRTEQIKKAREVFLRHRSKDTPVGIVRAAGRENEEKSITNLADMLENKIDMLTTVIIGNSQTYTINGKIITPRGYDL